MKRYMICMIAVIFTLSSCTTSKKIESDDDFATEATDAAPSAEPAQPTAEVSEFDLKDQPTTAPEQAAKPKDEFSDFDDPAAQKPAQSVTPEQAAPPKDEFADFDSKPAAPTEQAAQSPEALADKKIEDELSLDSPAPAPAPQEAAVTPPPVEAPLVSPTPEAVPAPVPEVAAQPPAPEVAPTPAPAPAPEPLAKIDQIYYKANQNGGAITIAGDRPLQFTTRLNSATNQLVVEVQNSVVPSKLKRSLNTKDMASSIGSMDIYQKANSKIARFVVQLRPGSAEPLVQPEGNSLLIIGAANEAFIAKQKADAEKLTAEKSTPADGFVDLGGSGIMGTKSLEEFLIGNQKFYGKKISIETSNVDIKEAINFIAEESGVNLLMDEGLSGQISLRLRQVPWDQALVLILKAKKLGYVRQGNVLRIAKLQDLQDEELSAYKMLDARRSNQPFIVKRFFISYADLKTIQQQIRDFIATTAPVNPSNPINSAQPVQPGAAPVSGIGGPSASQIGQPGVQPGPVAAQSSSADSTMGRVIADDRTGTLIVTDTPDNMAKIEKLITALDTQPKQIVVETRIINATESFSKSIGFNWNSGGSSTSANSAAIRVNGLNADSTSPGLNSTFTWKNLDIIGDLDAIISLGETQEKVKVLNTQRTTVNSGKSAKIGAESKFRIPITQTAVTSAGSTPIGTAAFDTITYGLKGTVLPQASNENTISADVDLEQIQLLDKTVGNTADNQIGGRVLSQSGQTVAVNASFVSQNTSKDSGVPGLKDVPVLGYLFKGKSEDNQKSETLVFLTMTILEPVTGVFKKASGEIDTPVPTINQ